MACSAQKNENSSDFTFAEKGLDFTLDLYKQCTASSNENIFFSPLSISMALCMTLAGAKGNTAKEMKEVLKLGLFNTDDAIHEAFQDVINSFLALDIKLHIANRMYIDNKTNILANFQSALTKYYQTSAKAVDFKEKSEKMRIKINKWVEKQTEKKINNLIPAGILNDSTRLVLVNAIYFKGNWLRSFKPKKTFSGDFFLTENTAVKTDFMKEHADFNYVFDKNHNCRMLELPYKGKALSMYVVLSVEVDGLEKLVEKLNVSILNDLMSRLSTQEVKVTFPKFIIESTLSLNDILSGMGMNDLFSSDKADLSGITGKRDLWVSASMHKAFLDVNEKGSEAAAATFHGLQMLCTMSTDLQFIADHAFLLFIRDNRNGCILFWGRVINPNPTGAIGEEEEFSEQDTYADEYHNNENNDYNSDEIDGENNDEIDGENIDKNNEENDDNIDKINDD